MIIKIFGKISNQLNRYLSEKTVSIIKEKAGTDSRIEFYDTDKPIGMDIAKECNILYLPTVILEDEDGEEIAYIESNKSIIDINLSHIWWTDLELFLDKHVKRNDNI